MDPTRSFATKIIPRMRTFLRTRVCCHDPNEPFPLYYKELKRHAPTPAERRILEEPLHRAVKKGATANNSRPQIQTAPEKAV